MARWLVIPVAILLLLLTGAAGIWFFSYGLDARPPAELALPGLSAPVEVGRLEGDAISIRAANASDAYTALGYAHGLERPWLVLLLRQAALGRTGEWFGEKAVAVDRFTRQLGLAEQSRLAWQALPPVERTRIEAYTAGLNAAFGTRAVRVSGELALLRLTPERWEPWHTLALERLYAWLATTPPGPERLRTAGDEVAAFFAGDALLRRWLHLHGFEHGMAWALADSSGTTLYQRQVYGDTALPFYLEVVLQWPGQAPVTAASLPGTPFLPSGRTATHAWSVLPASDALLHRVVYDSTRIQRVYERVRYGDDAEELVVTRRAGTSIVFSPTRRPAPVPPPPDSLVTAPFDTAAVAPAAPDTIAAPPAPVAPAPDSAWAISWSGFAPVSDAAAWQSVLTPEPQPFSLISGSGLVVTASGGTRILGVPRVSATLARGVLVGNASWTAYAATALDTLTYRAAGIQPSALIDNFYSAWAARLALALTASVDSIPRRTRQADEALTYLRNWDFAYDAASIAGSIFDAWVTAYRDSTGAFPTETTPDTVFFENQRRYQILLRTLDDLRHRFGPDLSEWRWENVQPDLRHFPVWSADSVLGGLTASVSRTRYAPVRLPGRGHPSALYWGDSSVEDSSMAPAMWESWITTSAWDQWYVRRQYIPVDGPLARYQASDRVPPPLTPGPNAVPERITRLIPRESS